MKVLNPTLISNKFQAFDITTYAKAFISPWSLLSDSQSLTTPDVSAVLITGIFDIEGDPDCHLYKQWVQDLPVAFRAAVTEKVIKKMGKSRRCAQGIH